MKNGSLHIPEGKKDTLVPTGQKAGWDQGSDLDAAVKKRKNLCPRLESNPDFHVITWPSYHTDWVRNQLFQFCYSLISKLNYVFISKWAQEYKKLLANFAINFACGLK
jgi:hypothetical protein